MQVATELRQLDLDLLEPGRFQPRTHFPPEELQELADSFAEMDVVQPVVVRPIAGGRFEIVAGERRWRAAQLACLATIPALVRRYSDEQAAKVALLENIQRSDLSPVEEARAVARMADDFLLTHDEIATALGRSRPFVSNLIRILSLSPPVLELVDGRALDLGHAKVLVSVPEPHQTHLGREAAARGWSVRMLERQVKTLGREKPEGHGGGKDSELAHLESQLSELVGNRVEIQNGKGNKGRLSISYNSLDELDGVLDLLRKGVGRTDIW